MKSKTLLAIFLLGVVLCFVPMVGYGKVEWQYDEALSPEIIVSLLSARIDYMMVNPTNFLDVSFYEDPDGRYGKFFPEGINTKNKICVLVYDNRDVFYGKSGLTLLEQFKNELEVIYWFISHVATDMDADIAAVFYSVEGIPLGYFYQGEYYLWEK